MTVRKSRHLAERSVEVAAVGDVLSVSWDRRAAPSQSARPSPTFVVAIAVFLAWTVGLVTMAIFATSPVTLNHDQIRRADVVALGTVDASRPKVFRVDRTWPAEATEKLITIEGLDRLSLNPTESRLVPLHRVTDGSYTVVTTSKPPEAPLTYPATDDVIAALEGLLRNERR